MSNKKTVNYSPENYAKTNFKICTNMQRKLYFVHKKAISEHSFQKINKVHIHIVKNLL